MNVVIALAQSEWGLSFAFHPAIRENVGMSISSVKIHSIIGSHRGTLIVFFTNAHCWQFRIIDRNGDVFGLTQIFYSSDAAQNAGREWLGAKN